MKRKTHIFICNYSSIHLVVYFFRMSCISRPSSISVAPVLIPQIHNIPLIPLMPRVVLLVPVMPKEVIMLIIIIRGYMVHGAPYIGICRNSYAPAISRLPIYRTYFAYPHFHPPTQNIRVPTDRPKNN